MTLEELKKALEAYTANPDQTNTDKLVKGFASMIKTNAELYIDAIPSPINPNVDVPSGFNGPDGKFYVHVFTDKEALHAVTERNGKPVHLQALNAFVLKNQQIGGYSLNPHGTSAVLITNEDLHQ